MYNNRCGTTKHITQLSTMHIRFQEHMFPAADMLDRNMLLTTVSLGSSEAHITAYIRWIGSVRPHGSGSPVGSLAPG